MKFSIKEWYTVEHILTGEEVEAIPSKYKNRHVYTEGMVVYLPSPARLRQLQRENADNLTPGQHVAIEDLCNLDKFRAKKGEIVICIHHLFPISLDGHPTSEFNLIGLATDSRHFHLHVCLGALFVEWQIHYTIECMSKGFGVSWSLGEHEQVLLEADVDNSLIEHVSCKDAIVLS